MQLNLPLVTSRTRARVRFGATELGPVSSGRVSARRAPATRWGCLVAALCGSLLAAACQKHEPAGAEANRKARSAEPAGGGTTAPQAPAAPEKPWYVGEWSGNYTAEKYTITMSAAEGAVREWSREGGQEASGPGDLSVEVAADGSALGTASGALGKMLVTGKVEDEVLTLQLKPIEAGVQSYHGFVVAKRDARSFKGKLQASSGDGTRVRTGTVQLQPRSAAPGAPGLGG